MEPELLALEGLCNLISAAKTAHCGRVTPVQTAKVSGTLSIKQVVNTPNPSCWSYTGLDYIWHPSTVKCQLNLQKHPSHGKLCDQKTDRDDHDHVQSSALFI